MDKDPVVHWEALKLGETVDDTVRVGVGEVVGDTVLQREGERVGEKELHWVGDLDCVFETVLVAQRVDESDPVGEALMEVVKEGEGVKEVVRVGDVVKEGDREDVTDMVRVTVTVLEGEGAVEEEGEGVVVYVALRHLEIVTVAQPELVALGVMEGVVDVDVVGLIEKVGESVPLLLPPNEAVKDPEAVEQWEGVPLVVIELVGH